MLRVSLIRLYLRIRSLAVLEVRDGDALTYKKKNTRPSLWRFLLWSERCRVTSSRRLSSVNIGISHLPGTSCRKLSLLAINVM